MELPADTTQPVTDAPPYPSSAPAQRPEASTTTRSVVSSTWTTLLTFFVGDALGLLLLLAGTRMAAPWVAPEAMGQISPLFVLSAPLLLAAFYLAGFYQPRFIHPALEMRQVALTTGLVGGAAALSLHLAGERPAVVLLVGVAGAIGAVVLPTCRVFARVLFSRLSWWGLPTVVVSSGDGGEEVLDTLDTWPEIGLRPIALLSEASGPEDLNFDLGGQDWAPYLAQTFDIPYAVLSAPDLSRTRRAKLLMRYSKFFDHVFVAADASTAPALWKTGQSGNGLRGYGVRNPLLKRGTQILKRTVDLLGASLALLLLAPVFAGIALLIKMDSDGPVFYRQERMGSEGQIFTLLKFRSMYCDADERLAQVLNADPERRREYERYHKLDDDPRVTPVGDVLRRYSLDELPQLLNVLRGDMSLVGPRAYMPSELSDMEGLEKVILQTPPGVTGLWQVSGRNELSFDERVDLDVHYVQNWSLWLDLYLLVRTIPTVLTGEGAA